MREDSEKIVKAAKSVYKVDLDQVEAVRTAKAKDLYFDSDGHIEDTVFTDITGIYDDTVRSIEENDKEATPRRVSKEIRAEISALFGDNKVLSEIPADEVKFRPKQLEFLNFYKNTQGNTLLGLRTGEGKTTTYMHIVLDQLKSDPDKYVVITTPKKLLRAQIIGGCIKKFGTLSSLEDQVLDLKEDPSKSDKKLIIDTPQAVKNMIEQGKLDPDKISLIVMDEGAIGSNSQTGDYDTFNIASSVENNNVTRIIIADGTPIQHDFLEDEFNIKNFFYGEDPRFVPPTHVDLVEVPLNEDHLKIKEVFAVRILKRNYSRFLNFVNDHSCLRELGRLLNDGIELNEGNEIPYMKHNVFQDLQSYLSRKIKGYGAGYNEEKIAYMRASSCLAAFHKTQNLYKSLHNEDYRTVIEKINFYREDAKKRTPETTLNTLLKVLLIDNKSKHNMSVLVRFADRLQERVDEGLLHPKEQKIKELLEQIKKEGKKVLIICDHIPTLNSLNFLINQKFGHKAFAIHGGATKKNRSRQQYAIERFNEGESNILIGTSVIERGLDLPDLDYVITCSPSRNAATELQVRGRLRKGGTMMVLSNDNYEKNKFFKNRRKSHEFFRERAGAIHRQRLLDLESNEKEAYRSKFHGKKKTEFFTRDLSMTNEDSLNKTFSERFVTMRSQFNPVPDRYRNYVVKIVLGDRSGVVDYYYYFDSRGEAQRVFDQIGQRQEPVIVNGRVKFSRSGNPYLVGHHTPGYFIEGIIECPQEDVPYEELGMLRPPEGAPVPPSSIRLAAHTNQFHGVGQRQLTFRDHSRNNPPQEGNKAGNGNLPVQRTVQETRRVLVDPNGQCKLDFKK